MHTNLQQFLDSSHVDEFEAKLFMKEQRTEKPQGFERETSVGRVTKIDVVKNQIQCVMLVNVT